MSRVESSTGTCSHTVLFVCPYHMSDSCRGRPGKSIIFSTLWAGSSRRRTFQIKAFRQCGSCLTKRPPHRSRPTLSFHSIINETMTTADDNNETKARIHRDLNERAGLTHNYGQPKRAPHAGANHQGKTTAKFLTNCSEEHMNSLQCIERNYQNRSACEPFFQAYKACRKEENQKRLEENEKKSQNGFSFF